MKQIEGCKELSYNLLLKAGGTLSNIRLEPKGNVQNLDWAGL